MAWYSGTLGCALPFEAISGDVEAKKLLGGRKDLGRFVHTYSRGGALLGQLRRISEHAQHGAGLYVLEDGVVLDRPGRRRALLQITALLEEIEAVPGIVREALKERHASHTVVTAQGFEPLQAQLVYPESATVENGWVYFYTAADVLDCLGRAVASENPRPSHDDEGESLEYVFGFLKSHLALLRHADEGDLAIVYAEMS